LKTTGHDVFPVNPHIQTFDGERCYPDVRSIPAGVDGVTIDTRPETTEQIVRECDAARVRRVGMHQSIAVVLIWHSSIDGRACGPRVAGERVVRANRLRIVDISRSTDSTVQVLSTRVRR
jgi:hypothetical protein